MVTSAERLEHAFLTRHIGWLSDNGEIYPPTTNHGSHRYESSCAVCRPDQPEAIKALVAVAVELLEAAPPPASVA